MSGRNKGVRGEIKVSGTFSARGNKRFLTPLFLPYFSREEMLRKQIVVRPFQAVCAGAECPLDH